MIPILTDESGQDLYFIKLIDFYDHSFSFTVTRVMERNEDGAPVKILKFASGFAYQDGLLSIGDQTQWMTRIERWEWEEQAAAISAIYDFAEKTFNERKKMAYK